MTITTIKVNGTTKNYGLVEIIGDYAVVKELKLNGEFYKNRKQIIVHVDETSYCPDHKFIGVGQIIDLVGYGMDTLDLEVGNHRVRGEFSYKGDTFHFEVLQGYHRKIIDGQLMEIEKGLSFTHIWSDNFPDENHDNNVELRKQFKLNGFFMEYTKINIMHVINAVFQDDVIGNVVYTPVSF